MTLLPDTALLSVADGSVNQCQTIQTMLESEIIERHIVLVYPEIHWNTGNIGRTCLATGAMLHLIKPLGFSLDSRELKRAGLDYWDKVKLRVWDDLEKFENTMSPAHSDVALFTKKGAKPFWSMPSSKRLFLIFGSETGGLPQPILFRYKESAYHIPIGKETRSLNLSTAVGIALYESLRHCGIDHFWTRLADNMQHGVKSGES